jgi:hypothetical protein
MDIDSTKAIDRKKRTKPSDDEHDATTYREKSPLGDRDEEKKE